MKKFISSICFMLITMTFGVSGTNEMIDGYYPDFVIDINKGDVDAESLCLDKVSLLNNKDFGEFIMDCSVSLTADPGNCDQNDQYTLTGEITFLNPPSTGTLTVSVSGGGAQTFNVNQITSPVAYSISGLSGDNAMHTATAVFSADMNCMAQENFMAPSCSADPDACAITGFANIEFTSCDEGTNTYVLTGEVSFQNPPRRGSFIVEVDGGHTQTFDFPFTSPQSFTIPNLMADGGMHTLYAGFQTFVFDNNDVCELTIDFTAPNGCMACMPEMFTVCDDGSDQVTLTAPAGYTDIVWYNSTPTQVGMGQTLDVDINTLGMADGMETFYYEALDNLGCVVELCCPVLVVTETCMNPCMLDVTCIVDGDPGCNQSTGQITATPSNGTAPYFYMWNTGATTQTITNLGGGTYSVTITDSSPNMCMASCEQTIMPQQVDIMCVVDNTPTCGSNNGNAHVTVNSGVAPYTYVWSNGDMDSQLNNVSPGTYTVTVTSANGCTATCPADLNAPDGPMITCSVVQHETCALNDGEAMVSVMGGQAPIMITWSDGQMGATASNLNPGSYTVNVVDGSGCSAMCSVTIDAAMNCCSITPSITNVVCNTQLSGGPDYISLDVSATTGSGGNYIVSIDNVFTSNPIPSDQTLSIMGDGLGGNPLLLADGSTEYTVRIEYENDNTCNYSEVIGPINPCSDPCTDPNCFTISIQGGN